jgi:serine/threonine protein kinase
MSPEHALALAAVRAGLEVPAGVDERSDVYSLGVSLYEALAGSLPPDAGAAASWLLRSNPRVGAGLAGIVARCLALDPSARYPGADALAADLRRHLGYLPPQGVPRRDLFGRCLSAWRRWRARG